MSRPGGAVPREIADLIGSRDAALLEGGRTNRVWRAGDRVAKQVIESAATPLFPNNAQAEWDALTALAGHQIAPEPLARSGTSIAYRYLDGRAGGTPPADVARLLHKVHQIPPFAGLRRAAMGQEVIAAGLAMLESRNSPLRALAPAPPSCPDKPALVHTDPVPANIVRVGTDDYLIDWQCPALGDPVEDIAHYLSPAMQTLYGPGALGAADRAAFLDAYPDKEHVQRYRKDGRAFHWRMAAYCDWQVAVGNTDYAPALAAELAFIPCTKA